MTLPALLTAYTVSNLVGIGLLIASWRAKNLARALYALLFFWAGLTNMTYALTEPHVYLDYVNYGPLDLYRRIIVGDFFSRHITPIVFAIACGQLAISALLPSRGLWVQLGLIGGVVFLIAIAPLGIGSAFPCTLTMAVGALVLLKQDFPRSLVEEFVSRRPHTKRVPPATHP